jgi:hypothetical protein
MTHRAFSPSGILVIVALAGALAAPGQGLAAQALDSTGMPSLELLALEAGRASRRHPIRAVAHAILCEPAHPFVDSASIAACAALAGARAAAITAAFARGLEVPLAATADTVTADADAALELPICPADFDRAGGPRVLLGRVTAPLVGVRDGRWEGRLTLEVRCRSAGAGSGEGLRTIGKEYLYQWSGRAWRLYQHSWRRAERPGAGRTRSAATRARGSPLASRAPGDTFGAAGRSRADREAPGRLPSRLP